VSVDKSESKNLFKNRAPSVSVQSPSSSYDLSSLHTFGHSCGAVYVVTFPKNSKNEKREKIKRKKKEKWKKGKLKKGKIQKN